jgi:hypothetical protein
MSDPDGRPHDASLPWHPCKTVDIDFFDTAPVRFKNVAELPVSPEQLFAIFEDPGSWPRWATGIGGVEWTSPAPFGPGTTRTVTFWGGMNVYEDFFLYDPPQEMAFSFYGTSQEVWTSFAEHYKVEPTATGCRLTWRVAYTPTGPFAKLHPILKPIMGLNLSSYMWFLRRYCRRQPTITAQPAG